MIGAIRLVNPWRGTVWGSFSDRLSVTTADGERWEIRCDDFYPGRSFSRHEIEAWAEFAPLSAEELAVAEGLEDDDFLGEVPARTDNPGNWSWYKITGAGEERLKPEFRPTVEQVAIACREAIEADASESQPLVDRFELWGCDLETGEPIALLLTGVSEFEARGTFSPKWRFCVHCDHEDYSPDPEHTPPTLHFENQINDLLLKWPGNGRVRFLSQLFERIDSETVREIALTNQPASTEPIRLKRGLLAEKFEANHRELRERWEEARSVKSRD